MIQQFVGRYLSRAVVASVACAPILLIGLQTGIGPTWSTSYAVAHDVVLDSTPGDGDTVDEFPGEIVLEFSGIPRDSFNTIAVSDSETSSVLFSGEPTLDGQVVTLEVPEGTDPGPGDYTVGFQITSSDGHATRGKTTFTVSDGAPGSPETDSDGSPETTGSSGASPSMSTITIGTGLLLLVIAIGTAAAVTMKRRK
ncbi:copper resistance CopC family protein [Corynebacterium pygosceleis]|uniref:Copper resistance protein CopC n=1 Tax=Corynebacterium pygosceleis TaxID=2800406 RepID=A0A9Q4C6X1_9CORY|nr:copper resistance protein CopC [Corynebacterium pygosceleis]MCK7636912.1 copper resistance protein CopC [Corynebacterium pygosceleis]MCK7674386.1 copper resistance protein CopC [Corynebacterium pygosceleis]MCL0120316.1 copper resistance protein CopC [Corynebacterium pygosceleis]MCX7467665.1 copper resistance protein CopC [Corynebacterium pygosceleis]